MSAHTPTPWSLSERFPEILGAPETGVIVARMPVWDFSAVRPSEGVANAAHIVRCVNAHDQLVAAARAAMAYDEAIKRHCESVESGKNFVEDDELDRLYSDWMTKSRDALAAAEVP